jgi:hypothetical protein
MRIRTALGVALASLVAAVTVFQASPDADKHASAADSTALIVVDTRIGDSRPMADRACAARPRHPVERHAIGVRSEHAAYAGTTRQA